MNVCLHSLAVLFVVLAPSVAPAEVPIPRSSRVHDRWGDRSGWCALETLAHYFEITELYHLTDKQTGPATFADLETALDKVNVNYRVQDAGSRNKAILHYGVREHLGVLVGFRALKPGAERRFVILVDYGPDEVRVLDSTDADGHIRTMPLKRFLSWWDGFALVIEPEEAERSR